MVQNLMTGGASIEDTLALWASSLREAKRRMRPLFTQDRVATSAGQFLDALLGNEPRKTGWMRAEAAGDGGPWRQQALLGRGRWDADALRDIVRDYVVEHLGDADAILVILAMVDDFLAADLLSEASRFGMDALVETHDEAEIDRAIGLRAALIGVNNRDLRTFVTDLSVTERLREKIPVT